MFGMWPVEALYGVQEERLEVIIEVQAVLSYLAA